MRVHISGLGELADDPGMDLRVIETFLVGMGVFFYLLAYPPFIFTWYIPTGLRLALEILVVAPMFVQQLISLKKSKIIMVFLLFGIVKTAFFIGDAQTIFSRFDKIVFAVWLIEVMRDNDLLIGFVHRLLEFIFIFTSIQVILTAFLWFSANGLFQFDALQVTQHSNYGYFGNILLGNVAPRNFGSIRMARPMGFFMEPGLTASMLVMYSFAPSPFALSKPLGRFRSLLLTVSALATASITAIGLVGARFVLRVIKKRVIAYGIIILGVLVTLFAYEMLVRFIPSGENRAGRTQSIVETMRSASPMDLLIGREIGAGVSDFGAVNSGIGRILIEYGLLLSFFFLMLLRRVSVRAEILVIIILMNIAFDFFWWPVFWVIAVVLRERAEGGAS